MHRNLSHSVGFHRRAASEAAELQGQHSADKVWEAVVHTAPLLPPLLLLLDAAAAVGAMTRRLLPRGGAVLSGENLSNVPMRTLP